MRNLFAVVLLFLALKIVHTELALTSMKEVEEAVPEFSQAIQAVFMREPFTYHEAEKVFFNSRNSPLDLINGLKQVRDGDEAEKRFRRDNGVEQLRVLGMGSRSGWGYILMKKSTATFLNQLTRRMAKYRPVTESDMLKDWFRQSFIKYLESDPEANGLDLKEKVLGAIEHHYPGSDAYTTQVRRHYINRWKNAHVSAAKIVEGFVKHGDLPKNGWIKNRLYRLVNLFRHRKASPVTTTVQAKPPTF